MAHAFYDFEKLSKRLALVVAAGELGIAYVRFGLAGLRDFAILLTLPLLCILLADSLTTNVSPRCRGFFGRSPGLLTFLGWLQLIFMLIGLLWSRAR